MYEPKTDRACGGHLSIIVSADLQQDLPIILRNRALPVRVSRRGNHDGLRCIGDVLPVKERSCRDIKGIRRSGLRPDGLLQLLPDPAVETILDLGSGVDAVIGLLDHGLMILAVSIRYLVATDDNQLTAPGGRKEIETPIKQPARP